MKRKDFEEKSLNELCEMLMETGETITTYETLKDFAKHEIDDDNFFVAVHICEALNEKQATYYFYDYCMGTLETPSAITSKDDLEHLIEDDENE